MEDYTATVNLIFCSNIKAEVEIATGDTAPRPEELRHDQRVMGTEEFVSWLNLQDVKYQLPTGSLSSVLKFLNSSSFFTLSPQELSDKIVTIVEGNHPNLAANIARSLTVALRNLFIIC
jgi:hypothetical protein